MSIEIPRKQYGKIEKYLTPSSKILNGSYQEGVAECRSRCASPCEYTQYSTSEDVSKQYDVEVQLKQPQYDQVSTCTIGELGSRMGSELRSRRVGELGGRVGSELESRMKG